MKAYLEFEVECNSNLCPHLFSSLFLVCHGLSSQCPHPFLYNWDFSNNVLKVFHLLLKLIHVSIYQYYHNFALISHLMLICSLLDSSAQTGAWADEPVRGGGTSASRHKQSSGPAHRLGSHSAVTRSRETENCSGASLLPYPLEDDLTTTNFVNIFTIRLLPDLNIIDWKMIL